MSDPWVRLNKILWRRYVSGVHVTSEEKAEKVKIFLICYFMQTNVTAFNGATPNAKVRKPKESKFGILCNIGEMST